MVESPGRTQESVTLLILDSMEQCVEYDVPFWFKQTGAMFKKGNKVYLIDRKAQMSQAQKAGVNYKC